MAPARKPPANGNVVPFTPALGHFRDVALFHANVGHRVLRLPAGQKKKPFTGWKTEATSDTDKIDSRWSEPITDEPLDFNVGIAMGDGFVGIDIDVKSGVDGFATIAALERELCPLPATWITRTPSGGEHWIYRVPLGVYISGRVGENGLGPGVDVRGDGNYLVAAGSVTAEGRYTRKTPASQTFTDLPTEWLDRIQQSRPKKAEAGTVIGELDTPENVGRAVEWLTSHAPPAVEGAGGDQGTYEVACRVGDFGVSEPVALDLMLTCWNERCAPPWNPDELSVTVANAFRYRQNAVGVSSTGELKVAAASPQSPAAAQPSRTRITATPYRWIEPAKIPPRDWLCGRHLIRGFASSTVAAGGVGKTGLKVVQALAMVSGRDLLGVGWSRPPLSVWLWNLEDPREELQRRVQAAARHYGLTETDLANLFVDSGREQELVIAETTRTGAMILRPVVDALLAEIRANDIDVVIVDPFVSSHRVAENDNNAVDMVAKEWGRIADAGRCAIDLVHHTRKMVGFEAEATVESARGGKALTDACRSNVVVNRMTEAEGAKAGVDNHRLFFRCFDDKNNLAPPADRSEWFRLVSVNLGNGEAGDGDEVGVVTRWHWPDPKEGTTDFDLRAVQSAIAAGRWRSSSQAKDWAGRAIAEALGLDLTARADKARAAALLKGWLADGSLVLRVAKDDRRNDREFVEVGQPAPEEDELPHLPG